MSTFYSTFGDKEKLFLSALNKYEAEKRGYQRPVARIRISRASP